MKRTYLTLIIAMLVIGFASVATNLVINGKLNIGFNQNEFTSGVIFTRAKATNGTATIEESEKEISFKTDKLDMLDEESKLEYEITNKSKQYDAIVNIECKLTEGQEEYEEYVEVKQDNLNSEFEIASGQRATGNVTVKLKKVYVEEDKEIKVTCKAIAEPKSREEEGEYIEPSYTLSGYLEDEEGEKLKEKNLVVYSENPKYVTSDDKGFIFIKGLERGRHEIYYFDNSDIEELKTKSKEEIKGSCTSSSVFTIDSDEIDFSNNYKIISANVEESEEKVYDIVIKTSTGEELQRKSLKYGEKYGELPEVKKDHYSFIKWTVDGEEISEESINKKKEGHDVIAVISEVKAPVITSDHNEFTEDNVTISITKDGIAEKEIKEYEYYISKTPKTANETAILNANKTLEIDTVGTNYVAYRTVAEDGVKSEWSNEIVVKIDRSAPTNVNLNSKQVDANKVTFNVGYTENESDITQTKCYYGDDQNNVTTLGNISNNKCEYPATASYAKVCVVNSVNKETCSNVKQLAMYFIKDGKLKVPFEKTSNIITNEYSGYYQIKTENEDNVNREGIYTTNAYDFSKYTYIYGDLAFNTRTTKMCDPGLHIIFSDINWLSGNGQKWVYDLSINYLSTAEVGYTASSTRKTISKSIVNNESWTTGYLGILRNSSYQVFNIDVYNVWFQYKE